MDIQTLLDELMSWSLPAGTDEAVRRLDLLQAEVCLKCGADKVLDLPKEPNMRREKLIDLVVEHWERAL
jgi:hypothetical protein